MTQSHGGSPSGGTVSDLAAAGPVSWAVGHVSPADRATAPGPGPG